MNKHLLIRKSHRYLGLFIGIQFLGWTISGLYFSWNDIDNVHGDHMRKAQSFLQTDISTVAPSVAIANLKSTTTIDSIHSVRLIRVLNEPVYQIGYFSGHAGHGIHYHVQYALANASTGHVRPPLTKEEAIAVAREQLIDEAVLKNATLLEQTGKHHEFRGRDLPAWALEFENPNCTVYVNPQLGAFQTIRHDQWRIFDFLWMFHTMDFEGRDDFNNLLLRIFSVCGLVTVVSGFALFIVSSRTLKKISSQK